MLLPERHDFTVVETNEVVGALKRARAIFAGVAHLKNMFANNTRTAMCTVTPLAEALGQRSYPEAHPAFDALAATLSTRRDDLPTIYQRADAISKLCGWNNRPETTHDHVLDLYDDTIARLSAAS